MLAWLAGMALLASLSRATPLQSTVDSAHSDSWGGNIGWIDWRAGGYGARFANSYYATGAIYSANLGWIGLGSGKPANGRAYGNMSAGDYGVNLDAQDDPNNYLLSGYAWSANAGWISFNLTDRARRPRIDKQTGTLHGYAWGANIGWLALESPGTASVITGIPRNSASDCAWALYP
jgi:di/tricarboxylate transporter